MATKSEIRNTMGYGRESKWYAAGIKIPDGKSKRAERIRDFMSHLITNNPIRGPYDRRPTYDPTIRCGKGIARMASMFFDEHGSGRGDYRHTSALDYVPPEIAKNAPFHDHGHAGMALVSITRTRIYSKKYMRSFGPGRTTEHYLCGRNEAGTWYSHRVPQTIPTVREAVAWIWSGMEDRIISRQGDIALIAGNGGPRIPAAGLPGGHQLNGISITHDTHPAIPAPQTHQRIIIGRRAAQRGDGAATQTRD